MLLQMAPARYIRGPRQVYLWPPPRHHIVTLELNPKMLYAGWFGVG